MAEKVAPIVADFTNVKDRGPYNPKRVTAGDYRAKVVSVEKVKSQSTNKDMLVFGVQLSQMVSAVYPYRCILEEANLWTLRNLLVAAGMSVPKKRVKVDPNKLVGKEIGISLDDDEYEGKMKSVINSVFSVDELTEDEPTDDDDEQVEQEEEEVSEEDLEELDVDEL